MIGETRIRRRHNRQRRSGWIATVRRLFASRDGAVGTEYGFLLAFIALVAAVGFVSVGDGVVSYLNGVSRIVESAASEPPNPLGGGGGSTSGGSTSGTTSGTTTGSTSGTTTGTTSGNSGGTGGNGGSNGSNGGSSNGNANGNK
jgi:Flp pilus assembly pilin Flp